LSHARFYLKHTTFTIKPTQKKKKGKDKLTQKQLLIKQRCAIHLDV